MVLDGRLHLSCVVQWEKWACHVAFDHREGLVLNTVTYTDGLEKRPLFYRLSIAEMGES